MPTTEIPDTESKSFWERLIGVFVSPAEAMADVACRPDFWPPLILAVVLAIALSEVMLAKIGAERIIRSSIEQSSRAQSMTPEQIQQAVEQGAKFAHIGTIVAPAGVALSLLMIAGVGLLIANSIFGAQLNFKVAFSVTCYANLIGLLGAVLGLVMIFSADSDTFNYRNFIPSNVGFFLDPRQTSKPLYSLATSVDLFTLWTMAVLAIGFSEATAHKVKVTSMFLALFGVWVIWVMVKMGWAALVG